MAGKGKFSLEAIFSAVDKLSAPLAKIRTKLGAFGKGAAGAMRSANAAVDKGLAGIGKFSNVLGIGAVASLAGVAFELKNVMTNGAAFEKTLVRAGSAFDVPVRKGTAGFQALSDAARNVGRTTEFSAQQAAEGLNSLATAGFSAKQSIAALPKIIDFASAGSLELGMAADIASDTLGAFGLRSADAAKNALNMGRAMDVMVRAAADSTTNVTELFEGIKMGGALAATSGVQIEEFTGLLGVLANAGLKGSEAGTAIRNSILRLTNATPEATKTMKRLGIQVARSKDGSIDMTATIGRFATATKGLTKAQKSQAIANVFGAYTVGPFLNLMNAGEDTIRNFTKNLQGATGTTKTMAETMRESTTAKIAKFFNVIEDVRLGVFEAISPVVMKIADSVSTWVTANQGLINTKATEWCTTLKDILPNIWIWTVRLGKAFAVFAVAAAAVKLVNLAVLAYEAATKLAAAVTWAWNLAMKAGSAATALATAAQWLGTAAQTAYAAVLSVSSGALGAFRIAALASVPAIGAQLAAMAPLLLTVGAAAAAVAALVAVWQQYNALDKSLEGSGGISGTIGKMIDMGTLDPFKAHDAAMNDKARADRDAREAPQVVTPGARAASEAQTAAGASGTVDGKIIVEAKPGTKAQVKAKPRTAALVLGPSGAFP
jgi:TP901 family phage tail tape measure protein